MNYAESQRNPGKHPVGLIIVIVMHVLLAWALVSGLARKVVDVVKGVNETKIVEEVKPPPPPPPENLPPPPKNLPPPPSFVPPPEVQINTPQVQQPTITTTTVAPPPAEVRVAPPPSPAPPAPAPATRVVGRNATINANDPGCKPEFPAAAQRAGVTGVSRIRFAVDANGKVTSAEVLAPSGPSREHRLLDKAAKEALAQCPFKAGVDENGKPIGTNIDVEYIWKLD